MIQVGDVPEIKDMILQIKSVHWVPIKISETQHWSTSLWIFRTWEMKAKMISIKKN